MSRARSPVLPLFLLCLVVSLWSGLAGAALIANQRARLRGIPAGLPAPVAGADVPIFCINAALAQYEGAELEQALDRIADAGFVWVRQTFPWARIEPSPGVYEWAEWDRLVNAARAHGLRVIAVLDSAPDWAGRPPPAADFARFAGAFAARYGERIDDYQIWHNPNLADGWGEEPNPTAYAHLLQQAAEAIRAADRTAAQPNGPAVRILLGSMAPTVEQGPENLSEVRFLDELYAADAAPYFDVLSAQPYGFESPPDDRRVSEDVLNFSRIISLREEMVAHGDAGKAIWASQFGWNSLPDGWNEVPSIWGQVDEAAQAAYTAAAVERARREWPWIGAMCLTSFQPDPDAAQPGHTPNADGHWGFAAVAPDGTPRPVLQALATLAHAAPTNYPGAYTPLSGTAGWEGAWEFSALGADVSQDGNERVTIPFWGSDFGLRVRRGNYRATMFVTIDGAPANGLPHDETGRAYLILTSPDYQPQVTTLPVATHLASGAHTAVIEVERGWDQWALAGWSVADHPDETAYRWSLTGLTALALGGVAGMVLTGRRMRWGALGRAASAIWQRLSTAWQMIITAGTALLLWTATWMTWGTEASTALRRLGDSVGITATLAAAGLFYYSPWFLLTVAAGLALFALLLLRPDLGLALIAALAPFYTLPRPLLDKAFSMAEIVTLVTLVSWGMRKWASLQVCKFAGLQVCKFASREAGKPADLPTCKLANLQTCKPADLPTCKPAHLQTLDRAVLALVLVAIVSPFFAEFQREAWRELRLVILEPAAFYLMLRTSRLDRAAVWRLVDCFVLGGVVVAGIGLVQYGLGENLITAEGGLPRLRSVYGSPNNVGLYLGRVLPLLVAIPLFACQRRRRLAYGLAALPVGAAILLSFSKGALLLGVPASLVTIGLLAGGRWLWATLAATAAAGLAAIPLLRLPRFASLFQTGGGTTFFRLKLWQATLSMIRDHPWLGVGLDNFLYQYRGRYILPDAWQEPDLSHPHNFLLDHWARLGVFGAAAGIWLQVAFWRLALPLRRLPDRDERALAIGLMGSMADMLAHGLVDHSFFLIDLAFAFFLTIGLVSRISPLASEGTKQ